jgi:cytochrome c peroxidase
LDLTAQEKKDLIAFLQMLTDSTFITDKRFSNPFVNK